MLTVPCLAVKSSTSDDMLVVYKRTDRYTTVMTVIWWSIMNTVKMSVSVSEAARLAGIARSSLYKSWIDKGRLSVTKDVRGRPSVDMAELLRVFPDIRIGDSVTVSGKDTDGHQMTTSDARVDGDVLLAEIASLKEQLKLQAQLLEAKEQNLLDLRQSLRLLEHKKEVSVLMESEIGKTKKGKRKLLK